MSRLHIAQWPVAGLAALLAESDAVVCTASLLAAPSASARAVLSTREHERHDEYTNEIVARRYLNGRRLVREMLGSALGVAPGEVSLRDGLHGKPQLASAGPRSLWFSLSHSEDLLVVALSRRADIGVDVERSRAFEQWQRVADRVLDPQERRQLDVAVECGEDPGYAFLRHWCRVEAELKAIGCGIAGLEAHRAGMRPRGLRLYDLVDLPLPADIAATGLRYQAAVALCAPEAELLRQTASATVHEARPVSTPASASTA